VILSKLTKLTSISFSHDYLNCVLTIVLRLEVERDLRSQIPCLFRFHNSAVQFLDLKCFMQYDAINVIVLSVEMPHVHQSAIILIKQTCSWKGTCYFLFKWNRRNKRCLYL
jgi:hypothetical protein